MGQSEKTNSSIEFVTEYTFAFLTGAEKMLESLNFEREAGALGRHNLALQVLISVEKIGIAYKYGGWPAVPKAAANEVVNVELSSLGAEIGAAVGSVVPVFGTWAGAAIGSVLGPEIASVLFGAIGDIAFGPPSLSSVTSTRSSARAPDQFGLQPWGYETTILDVLSDDPYSRAQLQQAYANAVADGQKSSAGSGATRSGDLGDGLRGGDPSSTSIGGSQYGGYHSAASPGDWGDGLRGGDPSSTSIGGSQYGGYHSAASPGDWGDGSRGGDLSSSYTGGSQYGGYHSAASPGDWGDGSRGGDASSSSTADSQYGGSYGAASSGDWGDGSRGGGTSSSSTGDSQYGGSYGAASSGDWGDGSRGGGATSSNTVASNSDAGGGGDSGKPILLDLDDDGISVTRQADSNLFLDIGEDGYKHRTAWVGAGDGVLMIDADGDGRISSRKEVVFTDWDPSTSSDAQALRQVFDSNHDGMLDSDDAQWSEFKVMVTNADGTVTARTLDELGIQSIDLNVDQTHIDYEDGSSIDGEMRFTRADGSDGTAATATLNVGIDGYKVEQTTTTSADGATTVTSRAFDANGPLASETDRTVSADGLTVTTTFDDNGDGVVDRTLTDVTVVDADGGRTRTETDENGGGVLVDRTVTTTSADGKTITIDRDQRGGGFVTEREEQVTGADDSLTITVSELSKDGTVLSRKVTALSADRLTRNVEFDLDGNGVFERIDTTRTLCYADGSRLEREIVTGGDGTLLYRADTSYGANNLTHTVATDIDGDGFYDVIDTSATTRDAAGTTTVVETASARNGSVFAGTTTTVSADGLTRTTAEDLDGDGVADLNVDVTAVASGLGRTRTTSITSADGTLISNSVEEYSADGRFELHPRRQRR